MLETLPVCFYHFFIFRGKMNNFFVKKNENVNRRLIKSGRSFGDINDIGSESTNLPVISEINQKDPRKIKTYFSKDELFLKKCRSTNASIIEMSKKAASTKKYFFDPKSSINKKKAVFIASKIFRNNKKDQKNEQKFGIRKSTMASFKDILSPKNFNQELKQLRRASKFIQYDNL